MCILLEISEACTKGGGVDQWYRTLKVWTDYVFVKRYYLSRGQSLKACLEVTDQQTCLSPPLSFIETLLCFVDDLRIFGKERPGEWYTSFCRGFFETLKPGYKSTSRWRRNYQAPILFIVYKCIRQVGEVISVICNGPHIFSGCSKLLSSRATEKFCCQSW